MQDANKTSPWDTDAMIRFAALLLSLSISACASTYQVAPPPNAAEDTDPIAETSIVPVVLEDLALFYVTDRSTPDEDQTYGGARSNAMAFGRLTVDVKNMSAAAYAAYMKGKPISHVRPRYDVLEVEEIVRFPGTPLPFELVDGVITRDRAAIATYLDASQQFRARLSGELERRGTSKVVLYVHGYNNSFDHGALNLLELWTAAEQTGVPVMFSWPTEEAAPFRYFQDTQNGAFSVYHLKETIRLTASTPGVETITVIAHSHGASIATTALRELLIETKGSGLSMYDTYRIETLILAAPDIDLGVMEQRLVTEAFGVGFGQINVYLNPNDNALGMAGWIFGNRRFGATSPDDLSLESRAVFRGVKTVHFISVEDAKGEARHSYFRLHPGVLADIATTIRTDARPGDPERPLEHLDLNFWRLDLTYQPVARQRHQAQALLDPAQ